MLGIDRTSWLSQVTGDAENAVSGHVKKKTMVAKTMVMMRRYRARIVARTG